MQFCLWYVTFCTVCLGWNDVTLINSWFILYHVYGHPYITKDVRPSATFSYFVYNNAGWSWWYKNIWVWLSGISIKLSLLYQFRSSYNLRSSRRPAQSLSHGFVFTLFENSYFLRFGGGGGGNQFLWKFPLKKGSFKNPWVKMLYVVVWTLV